MSHGEMSQVAADPSLAGLAGQWKPIAKRPGYALGLAVLALAIVILPLLYLAIIGAVGYGVYRHLVNNAPDLPGGGGRLRARLSMLRMLIYLAPALAGGAFMLLMLKPLIAPGARHGDSITLEPFEEGRLHGFVRGVCALVGAAPPRRIDIDSDVNASASFRAGFFSLLRRGDLVLTIGLPLVAAMSRRQFAGVLAHEFGHFAQGMGMRITYLAHSVVNWFIRAAYQRDGWDEKLDELASAPNGWIGLLVLFIRLCIWLGRLALKGVAVVGVFLCSFMLRQMEFDADRYEAQLAGSGDFAPTCRRILELGECYPKAMEDSRRMFERAKQLPDDFPALVADYCRRLTPEARDGVARAAGDRSSSVFSTHPSFAARIAAAESAGFPGLYLDESPASGLFTNFPDASRKATYGHWRGLLGNWMEHATFVPTAPLLKADAGAVARQSSLARYLGYDPPAWRPVFPTLAEVPDAGEARAVVERIKAARARLKPLAEKARARTAAYRAAYEEGVKWEQARAILDTGFPVQYKMLGLPATNRQGITRKIETLTGEAADAAAVIDDAGDAAAARVAAALTMLGVPGIEKAIPDAGARRARADVLLAAMGAMKQILPLARQVRQSLGAVHGVAATIKSQETLNKAKAALRPLCDKIRDDLDSARRIGGGAADPHAPADVQSNLGETLVGASPGWREFEEIAAAADTFVDRFPDTCRRTLAELVHVAEEVERALAEATKKREAAKGEGVRG